MRILLLLLLTPMLFADGEYTANELELMRLFRIRQSAHNTQVNACAASVIAAALPIHESLRIMCVTSTKRLDEADKKARAFLAAHFPGSDPMLPNEVYYALHGHCYMPEARYHDGWGGCTATRPK